MAQEHRTVHVLDYGAGNVRSVENAIAACGFRVHTIVHPEEILEAKVLVFPGVGSFGNAVERMQAQGYVEPLKEYIRAGRRFFGICVGMQMLFEGSEESEGYPGLGVIPGKVVKFNSIPGFEGQGLTVPHIGWNGINCLKPSRLYAQVEGGMLGKRAYFVHSYCAVKAEGNQDWVLSVTNYGGEFLSAVQKGNIMATQFHPEKSGHLGLSIFRGFLEESVDPDIMALYWDLNTGLSRRIVACLDVRKNDDGDLVVTKGDGYNVREKAEELAEGEESLQKRGKVRNFGKPAELARRYFHEGADEITFLNITQFREDTLESDTMHDMLRAVSENVFVPLTIGGGIRDYGGKSALEVAARYFRSGADKVSLGSNTVKAVIRLRDELGGQPDGMSAIEKISKVYGSQAVVVSVDPRRIYLEDDQDEKQAIEKGYTIFKVIDDRSLEDKLAYATWIHTSVGADVPEGIEKKVTSSFSSPKEAKCWFQCTVSGGRRRSPLDAIQLVKGAEKLGAGEILLNSIDKDGKKSGFDVQLVNAVRSVVGIPVIASSGAGAPEHFVEVFQKTKAEAALAAGIFHREEVEIKAVRKAVQDANLPVRN